MTRSCSVVGLGWLLSIGLVQPALAQVVKDSTVGTNVSTGPVFTVTGGTRPSNGPNLFHSFSQFSLPTGSSAIFQNDPAVKTIFSRVTGGSRSDIDGMIQTQGNASLFLMNPNGIVFGPNAKLELGASFVGTTANSIKFEDGIEFSAANLTNNPLLTVKVPVGLQMGAAPATITNQSQDFGVNPNRTIALVGGDILLQGIAGYAYLYAPDGHIALGSVGSNSVVGLTPAASGWNFDYNQVSTFQNISLTQSTFVETSGNGGGSIQLQGKNIRIQDASQVYNVTSGAVSGGDITVQASTSLSIAGNDGGLITSNSGAMGDVSNITVQTPNVSIMDGGLILAYGGSRNPQNGNINLKADRVDLFAIKPGGTAGRIATFIDDSSPGKGGDINLTTQYLALSGGGQISANTSGAGNAGNLTIRATTLEATALPTDLSATGIQSITFAGATGKGGTLTVDAQRLSLSGGANILAGTFGAGNSGNIVVRAANLVADNAKAQSNSVSGLLATAFWGSTGDAGNITVDAQALTLLNGAKLSASTAGTGKGGNIIARSDTLDLVSDMARNDRSLIAAAVAEGGSNNAGSITIETGRLRLDGAQIVSATLGIGNAGNISIRANDILATGSFGDGASPSGIFSAVQTRGRGNAGALDIVSDRIQIKNGAEISSSTYGIGNAGPISIQASDFIQVSGVDASGNATSNISSAVEPQAIGAGGDLTLQTRQLQVTNGGQVTTSTAGQGNAGTINAQVGTLLVQGTSPDGKRSSSLAATSRNAFDAGSLIITADQVNLNQGGLITVASTGSGKAGNIAMTVGDRLALDNGKITSTTRNGQGGRIQLAANQLQLVRNSVIDSNTTGKGQAGAVEVNAGVIALNQSTISSQSIGSGNSGTLKLVTGSLSLANNARFSTAAANTGNAGNVTLQATEDVTLQTGSQLTSSSTGSGLGGTVNIAARSLLLNKNAQINASTVSSDGGNLVLNVRDVVQLRDRSLLNAEAGGFGNGGNIKINTGFVIGLGNSDIIANAVRGNGGNVTITTQGIFGLAYRPQLTPENDITASSQFGINGSVLLNTLNINPVSALKLLPSDVIQSTQLADRCGAAKTGSFVSIGRGGIPRSPLQTRRSDRSWNDIRNVHNVPSATTVKITPIAQPSTALVEASAMRTHLDGAIELVAPMPSASDSGATCALQSE